MQSRILSRRNVLTGAAATLLAPTFAFAAQGQPAGPGEGDGWFPFELINRKIFVPVRVNGVETMGFLDTGASSAAIDTAFAKTVGIRPTRQTIMTGWGREEGVDEAEDVTLELPGVGVSGAVALLRPMGDMQRSIGAPFDVIVGRTVFDRFVVELDFDASRARVHPRKGFIPPRPALAVRLKPSGGQLAMPIELQGRRLMGAIDLGASMPVSVSAETAGKLALLEGRPVSSLPMVGLGGSQVCAICSTDQFSLGPYTPPPAPVVVFDELNHQAVVGLPVFSRFKVWLDYGGHRLWLAPGSAASYWAAFEKNRVGLYTQAQSDGLLWVTHVSAGSPAETAGFKIGDRLKPAGTAAMAGMKVLRDSQISPGAELRYEMANGAIRTLRAAEYY